MSSAKHRITVFEHQTLKLHQKIGDTVFDEPMLQALQAFYGEKGVPYYSLVYKGVKFCEYVGVIQVGNMTVEVLPKADKTEKEALWREVLIGMVQAVGAFEIHAPSSSDLRLNPDSVLDLYFGLFVQEVERLLHRGLVKKYRMREGNRLCLKGSIQFAKHVQKNLVHQERFYVRYSTYDVDHTLHQVLYKTLVLLKKINTHAALQSRIGSLLLNFPEQQHIPVSEATFAALHLDRKTEPYRLSLSIAQLLLLNYHPDVSVGNRHVLALMFDMNLLWEQFIYVSLRKGIHAHQADIRVTAQNTRDFWRPEIGYKTTIRPDIVVEVPGGGRVVLDTKWKNVQHYNPSSQDLKQLYVYHEYYGAQRVALVYPGESHAIRSGAYLPHGGQDQPEKNCAVILLPVEQNVQKWQGQIYEQLMNWI